MGNDSSKSEGSKDSTSSCSSESKDSTSSCSSECNPMERKDKLKKYSKQITSLNTRLRNLSSYYDQRYEYGNNDFIHLAEDFPIQEFIDENKKLIERLERKQWELGEAIRQNNPEVLNAVRSGKFWTWPGLVGCTYKVAKVQILKENPKFSVYEIDPKGFYYHIYCPMTVRIFVDKNGIVTKTPKGGDK